MFGFGKSGIMNNELRIQSTPVIADTLGTARVRNRGVRELIHDSETAKRALREKDKGIFIDGQKKRKSTKKDKDSRIPSNCSVSAITRERKQQTVTLGPNKVSVSPSVTFAGDFAAVRNSEVFARRELTVINNQQELIINN